MKKIILTILFFTVIITGLLIGHRYKANANIYGSSLLGWWTLDFTRYGTGAGAVLDSSGNGNVGTQSGTPAQEACQIQQCLKIDGSDDYVNITDTDLTSVTAITSSAWVKVTTFTNAYNVVTSYGLSDGSRYVDFMFKSDGKLAVYMVVNQASPANLSYDDTGANTLVTGRWYHLVYTYDSSQGLITYVNGSVDATVAANGAIASGNNVAYIGEVAIAAYQPRKWAGDIDDVRIYNRALSASEVMELYQNGLPYFNSAF